MSHALYCSVLQRYVALYGHLSCYGMIFKSANVVKFMQFIGNKFHTQIRLQN